ncbi:Sodium/sulfate symporter [Macrolepiota fuliginosa MF-IS2]|uniref:Sodium/sulfate symporter n=1 Tax=Macrolepiota fuliginosa MF-IS2 TaxID=1400762 RepID=A0A9P6C4K1_9AGAR|nr:Sodium/sulfate symporter [Macrolepiota fuliginosa MF-IS2]
MKFSSALKFNAVADWWDEYIAYDALKKCIYQLEKQRTGQEPVSPTYRDVEVGERSSLLNEGDPSSTNNLFVPLLDRELRKIMTFYESQEKELAEELTDLEEDVARQEEAGLEAGAHYFASDDEDDDESISVSQSPERRRHRKSSSAGRRLSVPGPSEWRRSSISSMEDPHHLEESTFSLQRPMGAIANRFHSLRDSWNSQAFNDGTIWTARSDYAYDTRILFKRRITTLYISFTNLRSYVEINYSGFRKIIKKYDKVTYSELKDRYLHEVVQVSTPFTQASKDKVNEAINSLVELYARCLTRGDKTAAKQQLRLYQRENIAWERDTVWRQMVGRERRGDGSRVDLAGAMLVKEPEKPLVDIATPVGHFMITGKLIWGAIAIAIFAVLSNVNLVGAEAANNCLAILIFCTVLWASEAIPLFVTSLLVPALLIALRVIRDDNLERLSTSDATKYVFSIMFNPTIMLLIGGFTISSALSKTNIDRVIITRVLSFAGTKPRTVLLAFMCVSCFASMWISNVAAPTLCFTLIRPILRTLPPKSNFAPCLILAIALAANIGGQSSPISSPQNLIAIGYMEPQIGWGSWFAVALPVSFISIILIWGFLLLSYQPARTPDGEGVLEIRGIRPTREKFTLKQWWVTVVCVVTIGLWCVEHSIEKWVGDMGVIALLPLIAFFSTGVLKKDDFERFAWTIVFLAMGGIALGKGVVSSGLLKIMDEGIRDLVSGYQLYTVVLILSPIVLVISTFISHTIASVLLVPIAKEVGNSLEGQPRNLLIFITALICSAGMGMPVSGFPNQTAATQEDELGELYLSNVDFLVNGVPASIIATLVVSSVGFVLMKMIGL